MRHGQARAVASVITDSPLLLAALSSADRATVFGDTIRRATLVADLQPEPRYLDVTAAVTWLADADRIEQAMADLIADPRTSPAVRQLIDQLLDAAEQRAARWSA